MALVALEDGESTHTGTTLAGDIGGSLTRGSNSFVSVSGVKMMVQDGTMEIPSHWYATVPIDVKLYHSHSFSPDTLSQSFVTIEGKKLVLVGDAYSSDPTAVTGAGSNNFVEVA